MTAPTKNKPSTGRLWYGNKLIAENEPFSKLQFRKTQLIGEGYDKRFFKITY